MFFSLKLLTGAPFSPAGPGGPWGPGRPGNPMGPAVPADPRSPGEPCTREKRHGLLVMGKGKQGPSSGVLQSRVTYRQLQSLKQEQLCSLVERLISSPIPELGNITAR